MGVVQKPVSSPGRGQGEEGRVIIKCFMINKAADVC